MDAVALARNGIDFAVATLGTATTDEHLNRLFRLTDNAYFAFDGDRAGRKAAWRALENALPQVREGRQIRFVFLPDGQDPDSFVNDNGAAAFVKMLDNGLPLSEFLIQELSSQVDMETIDGRAKLAEMARPLVNKIPTGVYRELLINSLAAAVGLTAPKLEKMLANDNSRGASASTTRGPTGQARTGRPVAPGQPSVVRRAISLLLNNPEAGQQLDIEKLAGVQRAGVDLLVALIETVQVEPNISTAGLLERWRHDEKGRHLGKLAAADLPEGEGFDAAAELNECLQQLASAGRKERIELLIEKQRLGGLSDDEKVELTTLYQAIAV
jgi:DNA primase